MAEMAKFLFDTVFDPQETALATALPRPEKTYWSTDEYETARQEGFERGQQAGIEKTNTTVEAQTAAALESIAANVNTLVAQLEVQRQQLKSEGVVLANMIARSLASALMKREPLHEIEALFSEALNFLPDTPHIAVRINETLLGSAKEKLDVIATERGFQGKLILLGQSDISSGDCRIEWAQGGIVKDHKLVQKRIFEITSQHIEASFMPSEEELSGFDNSGAPSRETETPSDSRESLTDLIEAGWPKETQND